MDPAEYKSCPDFVFHKLLTTVNNNNISVYLCLNHVEEVPTQSFGESENVGVLALCVPQHLDMDIGTR